MSSCLSSSVRSGASPRLGRLHREEHEVQGRVGDARRVGRGRRGLRRELGHLVGRPRDAHEHVLERRLAEVYRKAQAKVVGFVQERVASLANARRQLDGDPIVVEVNEVGREGRELCRVRLNDDAHVAGRQVGRGVARVGQGRTGGPGKREHKDESAGQANEAAPGEAKRGEARQSRIE